MSHKIVLVPQTHAQKAYGLGRTAWWRLRKECPELVPEPIQKGPRVFFVASELDESLAKYIAAGRKSTEPQ